MTSSPIVCLIGETEALHFTPHRESFPHSYTSVSPSLTPTPHSESFPPLHITARPSLTPTHHSESFPHPYTSQRDLPSLLHITFNTTSVHLAVEPEASIIHNRYLASEPPYCVE
ncbi:hypothetical protein Hamer_G031723 [Homarus americanus]|uniref:Uncharacterized protein n=1 Tax=Homarus americanus TaxID=6706 RepID=A0A8J5TIJ5_HOMAM|nr:hypothetical protein Hamer_G031723 [Homarus americanus]